MARLVTTLVGAVGGCLLLAQDALAMHREGQTAATSSGGVDWTTVGIWCAIGLGIVLVVAWIVSEGRQHHWHLPQRPVHN